MMSASFANLALINRDRLLRKRMCGLPIVATGAADAPMSRECLEALEDVVKRLGVEARRVGAKSADVRMTFLQWPTNFELVVIAKASSSNTTQLHFSVIDGTLIYRDANGVAMVDVSGPAEAMSAFIETLKADVADALAASVFDAEIAALPPMRPRFN